LRQQLLGSWIHLWLAKTSQQPISQTTWPEENPVVIVVDKKAWIHLWLAKTSS
jgi:hypothetical protein